VRPSWRHSLVAAAVLAALPQGNYRVSYGLRVLERDTPDEAMQAVESGQADAALTYIETEYPHPLALAASFHPTGQFLDLLLETCKIRLGRDGHRF